MGLGLLGAEEEKNDKSVCSRQEVDFQFIISGTTQPKDCHKQRSIVGPRISTNME